VVLGLVVVVVVERLRLHRHHILVHMLAYMLGHKLVVVGHRLVVHMGQPLG